MSEFSIITSQMAQFSAEAEHRARLAPAPPFPANQMGEKRKTARRAKCDRDFWKFDTTYFPPAVHSFYAAPAEFHRNLLQYCLLPGVDIVLAPRSHAKTQYAKKILVWQLLTGQITVAGVYSETLPKAQNLLGDIARIIAKNPRIQYDYDISITENNADQFEFHNNGKYRTLASFSEGRSLRGYGAGFSRPEFLLADDIETQQSSFGAEQVEWRVRKLAESYASLEPERGNVVVLGNNFHINSATNRLLTDYRNGLLPHRWRVHSYSAWDGKPLWAAAYPADSEFRLREMLGALDEADWQGNYQMNPIPPDGNLFRREYYAEWQTLPTDVRTVIYCDPNLSLKQKGDSTGIVAVGYSAATKKFYVVDAVCKSFSDPNKLLDTVFGMATKLILKQIPLHGIAFDGNVTQESTWTAFVRNYAIQHNSPIRRIEYKRFSIDALSKNAQLIYTAGDLLFPPNFGMATEGVKFLTQFFAFSGKNKNRADDAPDAVIGAIEYLHERRAVRHTGTARPTINVTTSDF